MRKPSVAIGCVALLSIAAIVAHAQNRKTSKRAKLPTFNTNQTSRFFFEDVFAQLEGERPANPNAVVAQAGSGVPGDGGEAEAGATYAWSKIISAGTLEDEIKTIKLAVDKNVTTPPKFAGSGHKEVRRDFSVLAMSFAIINEYDGDVRWKKDAAVARDLFAKTASNTKAGGNIAVYKESKLRKEDLGELMNGAALSGNVEEKANNWEQIADRSPLMQRLGIAAEKNLAPWTSNESEFKSNMEKIKHEAEIVAAIGEALMQEGMDDGDDEDYAAFAKVMKAGALDVVAAVEAMDADGARKGSGEIAKACASCHENYR